MIDPISSKLRLLDPAVSGRDINDATEKPSFAQLLKDNLMKVNNLQQDADRITTDFSLGKIDNIHQVTTATGKAELALNLTLAIQNKVVNAYKEIMRMQV